MTFDAQREGAEWMRAELLRLISLHDGGRQTDDARWARLVAQEVIAIPLPDDWRPPAEKKAQGTSAATLQRLAELKERHVEATEEDEECPF